MQEHVSRADFYRLQPELVQGLKSTQEAVEASGIEPGLIHLIFLRASQLNGCAFCQRMHSEEARGDGERQARLDVLPAWRESPGFSERERAALAWTEALTLLAESEIEQALRDQVRASFSLEEQLSLTSLVVIINSWNRIVLSCGFRPDIGEG
ncbi:carboxymuconolactone decarboxylase family protein [Halomonas caseinilytica]|uniref:Alkylhydroperoxidase AhpD family core domain-containing protein n=1 Tax=Halomonas caseinilytica TaxID=438744 RepID=A0A1M6NF36_9GAMM|nr:carboxymuconolactone decarboxylase family protein [Halomonas caseinilytica]SEM46662.1 alkylhydroperoxidase AhpD family core domain-containing protein [Halomonas caseinilytica]SHJ94302.1 alkylhydroperoxidase AhpD family core domain-containing protein [Halomonas caseinilytica]